MISKNNIIKSLCYGWPHLQWSLPNDYTDFDKDIIWHTEEGQKPRLTEIEENYKKIAYIDERLENYPSLTEQLDVLYHKGYDGWYNLISEIKQKYPKPCK